MEEFAEKLFKLRMGKKISQQKLSKLSSYTQTYISLIETKKANPTNRCKDSLLKVLSDHE